MSEDDLAERLDAVERRLDAAYPEPTDSATDADAVERVETVAERLADLEAAVEAVEGYVGEIERVDEELERRADAALATADGLETRVESIEDRLEALPDRDERSLDDRLTEQTAAIEELRAEVGALDDRLSMVEPDAAGELEPDATDDGDLRGRERTPGREGVAGGERAFGSEQADEYQSERCTCGRSAASGISDDSATFDARRSAADGGFERPDPVDTGVEAHSNPGNGLQSSGKHTASQQPPGKQPSGTESIGREPLEEDSPVQDPTGPGPHGRREAGTRNGREGTTVSGWGGTDPAPDESRAQPSSDPTPPEGSGTTPSEDRSWTDANSETLLDRLRSLL